MTNENKHEYVTLRANQTLVGCRRAALDAVSRGFQCMGFHSELRRFNGNDMRTLICGSTLVTAQLVLQSVDLDTPEWRRSHVPRFIRCVGRRARSLGGVGAWGLTTICLWISAAPR